MTKPQAIYLKIQVAPAREMDKLSSRDASTKRTKTKSPGVFFGGGKRHLLRICMPEILDTICDDDDDDDDDDDTLYMYTSMLDVYSILFMDIHLFCVL